MLALLGLLAAAGLLWAWMDRTFAYTRGEERLSMRAARVALRSDRGSVATGYALVVAAMALAVIGWLGVAEAAVEVLWPQVACSLDDVCMGR